MIYSAHRPDGYRGRGDSRLAQVVQNTRRVLSNTQRDFAYDSLRLGRDALGDLAGILVDFAEDLHNGTGIWEAYERYNVEFFGTALPLTTAEGGGPRTGLHPDRFRHFLWVLYPAMIDDGLRLSPGHEDLRRMADASSVFLADAFSAIPKDSGVRTFLQTPNAHAWDVKRKLLWLGRHSFMFRTMFALYIDEKADGRADIGHIDDFVCQECTQWSGLGAIDILAGVLDISEDDRKDLRSWYERHASHYKIVSAGHDLIQAVNLVSDQPYRIRINMKRQPFKAGQQVFGSLVPWRGEWYWSGEQMAWDDASHHVDVDELKQDMKRHSPQIVCRYWKEYEAQVRQRASDLHERMMTYYGKDLIAYPDGLSMAADWQKELRWHWESSPQHEVKEAIEKHGLKEGRTNMNCPKDLLEHTGGLGVFLNPDEGKEIMTHFESLVTGLKRKGDTLTGDQERTIRGFFDADAVSPRFAKRVLDEYGDESVKTAFFLKGDLPSYWLDHLLRCHKGHFYRKRYPSFSVI
jgi:hypothetical protein